MDNFDNNNMGGFEPQRPFTERPVQNNNMNTEQTIPVSEPETQEEQAQNVQPQNGNTPYGDYIFGNNNQNTANNANPTENVPPYQQNQNPNPNTYAQPWQYGYGQYPYSGQNPQYNQNSQQHGQYRTTQGTIRMYLRISRICTDSLPTATTVHTISNTIRRCSHSTPKRKQRAE